MPSLADVEPSARTLDALDSHTLSTAHEHDSEERSTASWGRVHGHDGL